MRVASKKLKYLLLFIFIHCEISGATPPRLVSLTPQATEIIFQLGHGSSVIATSDYSDSLPEAKNIPRLGGGITPGLERIIRFHPEWVVGNLGANRPELTRALHALGTRFFSFNISNLDELILQSSVFLKEVFQETHNPNLEHFKKCVGRLKPAAPFQFLAFAWVAPPVFFGHRTLLCDLLTRLGGKNALPNWKMPYPQISDEWIINRTVSKVFYVTSLSEDAQKNFHRWWPNRSLSYVPMSPNTFSHASFSPLLFVNRLIPGSLPPECARE